MFKLCFGKGKCDSKKDYKKKSAINLEEEKIIKE